MKLVTIFFILALVLSLTININYFYQDYKEHNQKLKEIYQKENKNIPEFMKNGEWLDIVIDGYEGQD